MNAPHTPGPWVAEINDTMIWIRQADPDAPVICDLVPRDADVFADEDEANANLIAASPDLLAAASAALHLCQSLVVVREGASDDLILRVGTALGAAIAKAEGRS